MERYCNNTWARIVQLLNSDNLQGLDEQRCLALQKKYGLNKVDVPSTNKLYMKIVCALKQKYVLAYIMIIIMLFYLKSNICAYIVTGILAVNLIITVIHHINRDKGITELSNLEKNEAIVIRGGVQRTIKSEELVVGDIVKVGSGSVVPADIRIIETNNLLVDEKSITGEDKLSNKFSDKIIGSVNDINQMKNILFKGTQIKSGDATGVVIATGTSSQLGKLLSMMIYSSNRKHNFGCEIYERLGKYLLIYLAFCIVFSLYSVAFNSEIARNHCITALFALGCFPMFFIQIIGAKSVIKKFIDENIHIVNFSVFNLVKDVNILFLDKIGSISKKEMEVKKIYINNDIISTDDPYVKEITFDRIVEISLICNNSIFNGQDDNNIGELDELAFLKYAARKKIYKSSVDARNTKIIDIPMDSDKSFVTVVTKLKRGCRANSRGNVDSILDICTHFMVNGIERELTEEIRSEIKRIDMNLSIEGMITEGFAYRNFSYEPSKSENIESNMVFVGIMGLENPLEDNLENSISKIKDKALVPIIFTEESKLSAITNAAKANLIKSKNQVVAGIELDSLNQSELKELLCRVRVFCRVTPDIKSKIVSLFIKDGHKVATTGEVLGDLPALNLSNVGIAKGKSSNVVKKICDVHIEKNYLDGFFRLRNFQKTFNKNIDRAFRVYFMVLLSEFIVLFMSTAVGQVDSLDMWNIITINGILSIPLTLMIILRKGREIAMNTMILRSILLSIVTLIALYGSEGKEASVISVVILSIGTILFVMFNSGISIRKFSNELVMFLISLLIVFVSVFVIIYMNNVAIRDIIVIELIFSAIFFLVFEILCRKWQDSLMR